MKRIILSLAVLLCCAATVQAQKMASINTESILSGIPEYLAAQQQLDALSEQYKTAIENEVAQIEKLYNNYQSRKNSLTSAQRTNSENEIISREKNVQEKQRIYFGEDGLMARKTSELMDPIRAKVDKAVETAAKDGAYDLVLDLSVMQGVAYSSLTDISDIVIKIYNTLK